MLTGGVPPFTVTVSLVDAMMISLCLLFNTVFGYPAMILMQHLWYDFKRCNSVVKMEYDIEQVYRYFTGFSEGVFTPYAQHPCKYGFSLSIRVIYCL
jgi:hypothetical protein